MKLNTSKRSIQAVNPMLASVLLILLMLFLCMSVGCSSSNKLTFEINGIEFNGAPHLSELEEHFGQWDRVDFEMYYFWDDLGIAGYDFAPDKEIQPDEDQWGAIILIGEDNSWMKGLPGIPITQFNETLTIDEVPIDTSITIEDLLTEGYSVHKINKNLLIKGFNRCHVIAWFDPETPKHLVTIEIMSGDNPFE